MDDNDPTRPLGRRLPVTLTDHDRIVMELARHERDMERKCLRGGQGRSAPELASNATYLFWLFLLIVGALIAMAVVHG